MAGVARPQCQELASADDVEQACRCQEGGRPTDDPEVGTFAADDLTGDHDVRRGDPRRRRKPVLTPALVAARAALTIASSYEISEPIVLTRVDCEHPRAALDAALVANRNASPAETTLIHGGAKGADLILADAAVQAGMSTEEHLTRWGEHGSDCPRAHQGASTCKMAGHRRNADMIAVGADLCLAFPTHSYELAPGTSRAGTSRGTWSCADKARAADIPTVVVWGRWLYAFGDAGAGLLTTEAHRKGFDLGPERRLSISEALVPF